MNMKNIILLIITILLVPIVVLSFKNKTKYFFESNKNNSKEIEININYKNTVNQINLDDYVFGVVSCEMPALFEEEALKAQAIASRTYAIKKLEQDKNYIFSSTINDQCYLENNELKAKWNNEYKNYYTKIKKLIKQTKNKYITYNGKTINVFFFSMSNGYTEDSNLVFNESFPYLKSVSSPWDTYRKDNINVITVDESNFLKKLGLREKKVQSINITKKSQTGRILEIEINGKTFKGVDVRKKLNLKSTDFTIKYQNNILIITTKGYGHGVGMSQYGANYLAKKGKTAEEILKYYYKNIKIDTYKY